MNLPAKELKLVGLNLYRFWETDIFYGATARAVPNISTLVDNIDLFYSMCGRWLSHPWYK